ncbi:hypothetical protein DA075_05995 [Methylobacterium currus]|uniref:DNA methylase adenine-specific domain-containing protein n=2 Tax=Methylobacterium currus TaxID=2051553 RepID=A0A2R4WT68_9HYPH|nr:hypothetical protein DA075_05995 [Methylobacterium currus]
MDRQKVRTEADVQADIRQFLLTAPLSLSEGDIENIVLESPLGDRRRIDIELGSAVIEVKRDLRSGKTKDEAINQLAGYVETRTNQTGRRYVGILSDGAEWLCFNLSAGKLHQVSDITIRNAEDDLPRLLAWVEGVLATAQNISPTANEIAARLGAGSSSHALDRATLLILYNENKNLPSIKMKRGLWTRLLTSTLGTQFDDTDELFVEHTLLVNSAEIIAHAVIGIDVKQIDPARLLAGETFIDSGIYGVVEQDFFDWVIELNRGQEFARSLARRLARFDWGSVNQDVLKVLYESIIGTETRKRLGEYYTPDWLAEAVVEEAVQQPLQERVLDPACGSGTFLFHAIKKYISTAVRHDVPVPQIIQGITKSIFGMDLHPVAVTFARVTYILAIGRDFLTHPERGTIHIPVYLGDSVQWEEQATDLWSADNLVVQVEDNRELFTAELRFPEILLSNAYVFDQLVQSMADMASNRQPGSKVPSMSPVFRRLGIQQASHQTVEHTFRIMCSLHDQGRDHIWGYYVRNLARPMWLTRLANRVDVLGPVVA